MKPVKGFTLVELLSVLTVAGILLGLALPALAAFLRSTSTTAATNDLVTALNLARSEAVLRRTRVALCRSSGSVTDALPQCASGGFSTPDNDGYEDGWIVFVDSDRNWQPDQTADILVVHEKISAGQLTIRGQQHGHNADHVGFTALGLSAGTTGTLVVCSGSGWLGDGREVREVITAASGRIRTLAGDSAAATVDSCTP